MDYTCPSSSSRIAEDTPKPWSAPGSHSISRRSLFPLTGGQGVRFQVPVQGLGQVHRPLRRARGRGRQGRVALERARRPARGLPVSHHACMNQCSASMSACICDETGRPQKLHTKLGIDSRRFPPVTCLCALDHNSKQDVPEDWLVEPPKEWWLVSAHERALPASLNRCPKLIRRSSFPLRMLYRSSTPSGSPSSARTTPPNTCRLTVSHHGPDLTQA